MHRIELAFAWCTIVKAKLLLGKMRVSAIKNVIGNGSRFKQDWIQHGYRKWVLHHLPFKKAMWMSSYHCWESQEALPLMIRPYLVTDVLSPAMITSQSSILHSLFEQQKWQASSVLVTDSCWDWSFSGEDWAPSHGIEIPPWFCTNLEDICI